MKNNIENMIKNKKTNNINNLCIIIDDKMNDKINNIVSKYKINKKDFVKAALIDAIDKIEELEKIEKNSGNYEINELNDEL